MTKIYLLLIIGCSFSFSAYACQLPRGKRITVGRAYQCEFFYRFRLRLAALVQGYPIDFVNMRLFKGTKAAMGSVAQGIPLYLDIKTELKIRNRRNLFDRINVSAEYKDSLVSSLYGRKKIRGFKQHHQGIRMPYYLEHQADYPLTRVTATSNNGMIAEALEYVHRPALGVQYHPEKSFTKTSFPIYKWFLSKAYEYKNLKDNL